MSRLFRSLGFAFLVFCVVLASYIGTRLDEASVHLIAGAVIGVLVAVPLSICIVILSMRYRSHQSHTTPTYVPPPISPQYFVLPQLSVTPSPVTQGVRRPALAEPHHLQPKRHFYFVGEDGLPTEIQPESSFSEEETDHVG